MTWKCYIRDEFATDRRDVALVQDGIDGRTTYVTNIELKNVDQGEVISPFVSMRKHETNGILQAIVDEAWQAGIKPRQLEDATNELKATKFHLEDMRLLAKVRK